MNFFKNVWSKINKPHGIWLVLFYVAFVIVISATLTLVIVYPSQSIGHYILYVLSAIMLTYFVYTIVIFAPKIKNNTIKLLLNYKFTNKLLTSFGYRSIVFGFVSFIINLAYIIFMGIMSVLSKTAWYFSITIYYIVLALMKAKVLYGDKKHEEPEKEIKTLKFNGIMLIVLTLVFSGVMVLIYKNNNYFEYAGLLIYAVAAFTFYNLTISILEIIKSKKQDSLYVENLKNINLASSLISIIILQVALFQAFSPQSNSGVFNALTGAGVSAVIIVLGIFMIIKANKKLKEINKRETIDQEKVVKQKITIIEKTQK